jgi:hypothetical protein
MAEPTSLGEDKEDRLREIFKRADKNSDGELSRAELILRLRKDEELAELLQLPQKVGDAALSAFEMVFQSMDSDEDKHITEMEFVAYFASYKSEFERAQTPDSRPSTAADGGMLKIKNDEPEPEPEPEKPTSAAKRLRDEASGATPTSPGSKESWKILQQAVKEPIYGEKIIIVGTITLLATGVRGFPRQPLPLNLMPVSDVPEGMFLPRRIDGQLTIQVDSQSIQDVTQKKSLKDTAAAQKSKSQDCSIRIKVVQARGLVAVWRSDGDIDEPADTCTAQIALRVRDRQGNVTSEVKCSPYIPTLDPKWCANLPSFDDCQISRLTLVSSVVFAGTRK